MLDNEPTDGAVSLDGDTTTGDTTTEEREHGSGVSEASPAEPQRRRAASRPAGPPPEPDELPPVATVTTVAAGAAHVVAEPAESPRPRRATRRRATPEPEPAEASGEAPAEISAEIPAETAEAPEPVTEEPAKPVRRSRTRKRAEAQEPQETHEAADETRAEQPEAAEETPARTRRRAGRKKDEEASAAPKRSSVTERVTAERSSAAMSAAEAEVAAVLRLGVPSADLPEERADAEPLDEADAAAEPAEDGPSAVLTDPFGLHVQRPAVPSVSFQAPSALFQPLFQAPDPFAVPAQRTAEPEEQAETDEATAATEEEAEGEGTPRRRRRRRGGRGRGLRGQEGEDGEESDSEAEETHEEPAEDDDGAQTDADGGQGTSRRRRRRRRRGGDEAEPTADDPPNTVVRIRAPRATRSTSIDEVQGVRGSTRLEAKKQRRREGRELGRRRPPIITESEFLARRESVERVMIVRRHGGRTQIAVLEDGVLVEHYVDRESSQSYVGNVYLGKVQNVLPSMEAAFVDVGKGRNAVLYAGEVNFDTIGLEGQPKRIEAALKSGQSVLVQVTKDPIGHKGARLTSQISLPGRYLVYVPDGSMTGISRKLPDKERARLKQILKKVMPENAGVIVRTAAEGASEEELSRDVARLSAQWENIQRKAKSASPPELLSGEPDLTIRVVRDIFNEDFSSLVVEGEDAWVTVDEYVRYVAPHLADRLSRWEEETSDVFTAYRVDEQIAKAMERKVWLPSGGSLVIDRTEAMTVVDVNTGKFTGQGGNLEETVTRNNLEAAEEIVRQLRLRDIGGIIVIDFIDMVLESNRDLVLRRLLECLARDRTKHQVAEVTSLGLVQMTRKRVGQGLLEAFSTPCDCCNGRGIIVSTEPVEAKQEPRGTQGKMAVEKAVADKLGGSGESTAVAAAATVRNGVTDSLSSAASSEEGEVSTQPRTRRRSRRKTSD
ncbi:Rne/Rng family ribonuclease [Sphaerimonospora sp. CA-214678]|uniref:Rne/Rng family ribonuclease n=1 Tax=Sphaerimonospora sp. CA-214678 TaxID=3240029 RepID=UPI003D8D866E